MSVERFLEMFALTPEAARLIDDVFGEECARSEDCRACVATRLNYWYMKWLFGVRVDPVEAARDIHRCLGRAAAELP